MVGPGSDKKRNDLLFFCTKEDTYLLKKSESRARQGQRALKEGSDELAVVNAGGSVLPPPLEHVLVRKALCKNNGIVVYTKKCRQFLCQFYVAKRTLQAFTNL